MSRTPLLPPIVHAGNRPLLPVRDRVPAALGCGQEQNRFLDVRHEAKQVDDLGPPSTAFVTKEGQFRPDGNVTISEGLIGPVAGTMKLSTQGTAARQYQPGPIATKVS